MVTKVTGSSARKSAPRNAVAVDTIEHGDVSLSLQERGASAAAARVYGAYPAPEGVSESLWARECAELFRFDNEHAVDFVSIHDAFAHAFRAAYGREYPRSLHADWIVLRNLVREHNPARALVLIDRAFEEALLVAAGIDEIAIVLNWAGTLGVNGRGRTRLSIEQADDERALIAEKSA